MAQGDWSLSKYSCAVGQMKPTEVKQTPGLHQNRTRSVANSRLERSKRELPSSKQNFDDCERNSTVAKVVSLNRQLAAKRRSISASLNLSLPSVVSITRPVPFGVIQTT